MRKHAAGVMDANEAECLINAARGLDIPIFEYIYQTGIVDGIGMLA